MVSILSILYFLLVRNSIYFLSPLRWERNKESLSNFDSTPSLFFLEFLPGRGGSMQNYYWACSG